VSQYPVGWQLMIVNRDFIELTLEVRGAVARHREAGGARIEVIGRV